MGALPRSISPSLLIAACLLLAALRPGPAQADVVLQTQVDDIQGQDWRAEGIGLTLHSVGARTMDVRIAIERLVLPTDQGELGAIELSCDAARFVEQQGWTCSDGRLQAQQTPYGPQQSAWSGSWRPSGHLAIEVAALTLAGGSVNLSLASTERGWHTGVNAYRLRLRRLAQLVDAKLLPETWDADAWLSGRLDLRAGTSGVSRIAADLVIDRLSYASPDGRQAAEDVVLKVDADARAVVSGWQFDSRLRWPNGALYADPLFIDAAANTVTARIDGRFAPLHERLSLDRWQIDLDRTLRLSGTAKVDTAGPALRELTAAAHSDDAGRIYDLIVQPFLVGTPADDLAVRGQVGFAVHWDASGPEQAGLELHGLALEDRQGRFALLPTSGSIAWDREGTAGLSRLTIDGVRIFRVTTDAFDISANFAADRIDLAEPIVIPVLGGDVALDQFEMTGALIDGDSPQWSASASVRNVSLEELTRQLDWPPFTGQLSGLFSRMRYRDQVFTVGGGLELRAFGGSIDVDGLRIEDPLASVPILYANATMRGLDLEAVTRTFSFGRIQGRLDADLGDLQLVGWQPDRFDLHLYTPPDDRSRRRISQRAVENLTELGSGIPAGLSTSLLRIFEEFSYDAIDVKILLRGATASVDGLARPDGGYYLVRGSGLPRIDVIGRNRSVAWADLLERLREIQVEGVKVE